MLSQKTQKVIDIIQWVIIICLSCMLVVQEMYYKENRQKLTASEEYNKENTYIRIYESQKADELKRENKVLYDSIKTLTNVETAMAVEFHEHYSTDTLNVDKFTLRQDTTVIFNKNGRFTKIDSIYQYVEDNDTIKLQIDVNAKDLKWVKTDISIYDKFMLINKEHDGINQTMIHHSPNMTIDNTTMWHRKENKKWYQRFVISPQVGIGYGIINKKPDIYVGVGVGYDF